MTLQVKVAAGLGSAPAKLPDDVDAPRLLWLGGLSAGRHRGSSGATRAAHLGLNSAKIFAPLP